MTNPLIPIHPDQIEVYRYDGGVNVQIYAENGKAVSVVHTDYGLWDVQQAGQISPCYTGHDPHSAGLAVLEALK